MTTGGASLPVYVLTNRKKMRGPVMPVTVVDGPTEGGKSTPVYVVTAADIAAGGFTIMDGDPIRVSEVTTRGVSGGHAIPVYVVSGSLGAQTPGFSSEFLSAITHYWAFDEADLSSGSADSIGSWNLTAYNAPTSVSGLMGNAAQMLAAENAALYVNQSVPPLGDSTWCVIFWWQYLEYGGSTATRELLRMYSSTSPYRHFYLLHLAEAAGNLFQAYVFDSVGASTTQNWDNIGGLTLNQWYMCAMFHDGANDIFGLSINGANWKTKAWTTGIRPADANVPSQVALTFGKRWGSGALSGTTFARGAIDHAVWLDGYVPTNDELAIAYNSGSAIAYS